ncbi:MAG TPA: twin-arginine translocase subunit TatC [Polyangia bacterium]
MDERRLPFSDHLQELRVRLWRMVLGYIVAIFLCWGFWRPLLALLLRPLVVTMTAAKMPVKLIAISPTEPLWVPLKLSMLAAVFVASPWIFWQLWQFIAPGLYAKEKRWAWPFVISSVLMFAGGAAFSYFVLLPLAYPVLLGMAQGNLAEITSVLGVKVNYSVGPAIAIEPTLTINEVFGFSIKLLLGCGLIFELPLLLTFLAAIGAVTHRSLWRFNRYAVVLSFIVGAIITPGPDVMSQVLVSVPLVALYNLSILIAWVLTRRREKRAGLVDTTAITKHDDDEAGEAGGEG